MAESLASSIARTRALLADEPHRRLNPLTREWVLVSPHRMRRPWQGQVESRQAEQRPAHDPSCYLCPDNERAGGVRNPKYEGAFAFDNDFAALHPLEMSEVSEESSSEDEESSL